MISRIKSKKNKASLFNVIDIVIVMVVAVILTYIVYVNILGHSLSDIGAKRVNVEYTIVVYDVSVDNFDSMVIGDSVMSGDGKTVLGAISKLKAYNNEENTMSVEVTVTAQAYMKKGVYRIDKVKVFPNDELSVRFPDYSPSSGAKCIDIKVI